MSPNCWVMTPAFEALISTVTLSVSISATTSCNIKNRCHKKVETTREQCPFYDILFFQNSKEKSNPNDSHLFFHSLPDLCQPFYNSSLKEKTKRQKMFIVSEYDVWSPPPKLPFSFSVVLHDSPR